MAEVGEGAGAGMGEAGAWGKEAAAAPGDLGMEGARPQTCTWAAQSPLPARGA